MTDRDDDLVKDDGTERRAPSRPEGQSHHLVVNDGELLDIGPDAETVQDVDAELRDRRGVQWPRRGRRASDREPGAERG